MTTGAEGLGEAEATLSDFWSRERALARAGAKERVAKDPLYFAVSLSSSSSLTPIDNNTFRLTGSMNDASDVFSSTKLQQNATVSWNVLMKRVTGWYGEAGVVDLLANTAGKGERETKRNQAESPRLMGQTSFFFPFLHGQMKWVCWLFPINIVIFSFFIMSFVSSSLFLKA